MAGAPDPTVLHPVAGQDRVVYLRPLVTDPYAIVGGNPARVIRRRYARAIMSGTPEELERIAAQLRSERRH